MLVPDVVAPTGERAKLLDFGLAKLARDAAEAVATTSSNHIMGTPTYMSPEQCRGAGVVDDKSDVYALGVMLYQMLAGRPPFSGEGIGDLISKHITDEPPPLSGYAPQLPPELIALVHRLLRKDKDQRPTMLEVVAELERLEARQGSAGSRPAAATATGGGLDLRIGNGDLKALLAGTLEPETEEESSLGHSSQRTQESSQPAMVYERTMPSGDMSPTLNGITQISGPSAPLAAGELPRLEDRPRRRLAPLFIALLGGLLCIPVAYRVWSATLAPPRAATQPTAVPTSAPISAPAPAPPPQKPAESTVPPSAPPPIITSPSPPPAAFENLERDSARGKEHAAPVSRPKPALKPRRITPPVEGRPVDVSRKSEFKIID